MNKEKQGQKRRAARAGGQDQDARRQRIQVEKHPGGSPRGIRGIGYQKFTMKMQKKLAILFIFVLLAFVGLSAQLIIINRDNGEEYKKQVLSQQQYDSKTLPYRRGDIIDRKGTKLAVSEKVYNVILDTKQMIEKTDYINPTIAALKSNFDIDETEIREYIKANPTSQYNVLKRRLTYDEISGFVELQNDTEKNPNIKGVWFEEEYKRVYPNKTLACDVIGFTGKDNVGSYGLEEYYNDVLNGTNGREYGYLNDDSTLERTTKAAVDGNTIVTTIDANIQSIVERCIKDYNDSRRDFAREGAGSYNAGAIIMDVSNGEILAMANSNPYDLNDPRNPEALLGVNLVDEKGKVQPDVITQEVLDAMDDDTVYRNLNAMWKNFCISSTYEPGSTAKPLTAAAGLESGKLTGEEEYFCGGFLEIGGFRIRCHTRTGDGMLTVKQAIEKSCNVALMQMAETIGKDTFLKYLSTFNIGLKTNIDLAGEARTAGLVFNQTTMGPTELATSSFGQGYNVTMIQMIAAFSSLVNGGYYYEPHMVNKIVSPEGATVRNIEPRVLKQTVSASTSEKILDYCNGVVTEGTGKTARPAGYAIGGKTGTAEKVPRNKKSYVVSFLGYAPADNPQIAFYVVVDEPNAVYQDDAKFATGIVREMLTEILPYMNIFMTEELSEEEEQELAERQIAVRRASDYVEGDDTVSGNNLTQDGVSDSVSGNDAPEEDEADRPEPNIDPDTGYAVDPIDGTFLNPETGEPIDPAASDSLLPDGLKVLEAVEEDTQEAP